MKQRIACTLGVATLGLALTLSAHAGSMEHGKGMDHGSMKGMGKMEHGTDWGPAIREGSVDGHTITYHLLDNMAAMEKMKDMKGMSMQGHDMSKMKSHHLMLFIVGPDGKPVTDAKVGYKVEGPGGEQKTMAMGMEGGFGADVDLKAKGVYEVKIKAVAGEAKLVDEFKYEVK